MQQGVHACNRHPAGMTLWAIERVQLLMAQEM